MPDGRKRNVSQDRGHGKKLTTQPLVQIVVRAAFTEGKMPWDVHYTDDQLVYLAACDRVGLLPHAMHGHGIVASTIAELKRDKDKRADPYTPEEFYVSQPAKRRQSRKQVGMAVRAAMGSVRTVQSKAWP